MIQHPFSVCISGYSGAGKTTLIRKLISILSIEYSVGYLKSDAHHFQMDYPGKDTNIAMRHGAQQVCIFDKTHTAGISNDTGVKTLLDSLFYSDLLIIEGLKSSEWPKLVFLDSHNRVPDKVSGEILAWVSQNHSCDHSNFREPVFHRDQTEEICQFILNFFMLRSKKVPLNCLVLMGGESLRMGADKFLLKFHRSVTQMQYCYEFLKPYGDQVFLSARREQAGQIPKSYPTIYDKISGHGPASGLLSAMLAFPECAWLVIPCDMPGLKNETIERLLSRREPARFVTLFKSRNQGLPEPLCGIYEPKFRIPLLRSLMYHENQGLRSMLLPLSKNLISLPAEEAFENINSPSDIGRFGPMESKPDFS